MAALTIKDIARICNVSISTVSRAINNDPTINAKTRERVMEVVREFNYIPNNSARNLKMTESNTVALIVKGINNPFFQGMFPYFQKRLEDLGYQYLLHTVGGDADEGYVAEAIAKEKRLKGIIFLGGKMNYPEKILENIRIPMVLCSVAGLSHEDNVLPLEATYRASSHLGEEAHFIAYLHKELPNQSSASLHWKVVPRRISPVCRPSFSHFMRCFEVP